MTSLPTDAPEAGLPARTIFLGSGAFAVPTLLALAAHRDIHLVGLVAPPDRPAGRRGAPVPVPTVVEARRMGLPTLQPERLRTPETAAALRALTLDLGVLADFGRIIPPSILELPRLGILNVHPSLLPRHRGATPVPATILAGDTVAGVSIILMDAGLDTGPVLAARSWPLGGNETGPGLEERAAREGAALVAGLLGSYLRGSAVAVAQDDDAATLTRPLS
ncbi:MAG: fmt, partial [Chloroflexi bacterium]|nr:fmt [Chloroflexota bacterium]